MLIYQSQANLDEKILFAKITHLIDPEIRKMLVRECLETKIPHSILVHHLCGIEVCKAGLRYKIQISIEGN